MFIELSFAQIWCFCRRKTAIAKVLMGGVKYIHLEKDNFLHCTNAGTISPEPSQGPAHPHHHMGKCPLPKRAQLKLGITGTVNTGTGILRPPRLLYNGAKLHQPPPIPRGVSSNPSDPHPNRCKSRYHQGTLH